MSELEIRVPSDKGLDELRATLDGAVRRHLPEGLLSLAWDGDVLRVSGPGASGSVVREDGHLVCRARLRPPASLMRPAVEAKIRAVLEAAARGPGAAGSP